MSSNQHQAASGETSTLPPPDSTATPPQPSQSNPIVVQGTEVPSGSNPPPPQLNTPFSAPSPQPPPPDPSTGPPPSPPRPTHNSDQSQQQHASSEGEGGGNGGDELWPLPPGWTTARRPSDGRVYYWETATGKTSWSHPMSAAAAAPPPSSVKAKLNGFWNRLVDGSLVAGGMGGSSGTGRWGNNNNTNVSEYEENEGRPYGRYNGDGRPPGNGVIGGSTYGGDKPQYQPPESYDQRQIRLIDNPLHATRRPDSHQCCACFSLAMCPCLGACAMMHSYQVDRAWNDGRYGDAVNHSKQAYNYAQCAVVLGIVLVVVWLIRRRDGDWEWPDWNLFDEWGK